MGASTDSSTPDDQQGGTGPQGQAPDKGFTPITSQDELDRIIKARLDRARRDQENSEELKKAQAAAAKAGQDLQAAKAEAEAAKAEAEALKKAGQVRDWRDQVAKEKGVPADLLVGESLEDLTAYADKLVEYAKPGRTPVLPGLTKQPDGNAEATPAQLLVRQLIKR